MKQPAWQMTLFTLEGCLPCSFFCVQRMHFGIFFSTEVSETAPLAIFFVPVNVLNVSIPFSFSAKLSL